MSLPTTQIHTWTRFSGTPAAQSSFIITTDPALLLQHRSALNAALASPYLHWAVALPDGELETMITNSVCFGLYHSPHKPTSPNAALSSADCDLIGLARLVTDKVTFAYLTDVYVDRAFGGQGLGTWLVECVRDWVDQMPSLRQFMLITGQGKKEEYYARVLGTRRIEDLAGPEGARAFVRRGPKGTLGGGAV
ncbi:hypothetical protein H2198_001645 [Neophaeococcomyces mojaviensis]|uniref:Uncharacterized protein n=1 Tax=Neophaeococcomyces mojaviensis TaxID=3383035 RepID=A0ACC3AGU8_9EURO|nr:hypothetical protein H2198_001645 [Knufia sp. JES_112]